MIIAIDGPAASGKGTLAIKIAEHCRLPHLDTGLLYRAVAQRTIDSGHAPSDEQAAIHAAKTLDAAALIDPRLRDRTIGEGASVVGAFPGVRAALIDYQKRFAAQDAGAVLDGRDIGTVICPDADVKLFIIASVEERARRRFVELSRRGGTISYEEVIADLKKRDARDADRAAAPLKAAPDAVVLDTTHLDPAASLQAALDIIAQKTQAP